MDWQTEAKSACLPKIEARLKARCIDFVEVCPWSFWEGQETSDQTRLPVPFRYEVVFVHRSALEFLDQKSAWLREKAAPGFDVNQSFWKAQLTCMKALPPDGKDSGVQVMIFNLLYDGVHLLRRHEFGSHETYYEEIYQVFKTVVTRLKDAGISFKTGMEYTRESVAIPVQDIDAMLLSWLASLNVRHLCEFQINQNKAFWLDKTRVQLLLDLISWPECLRPFFESVDYLPPQPEIIHILLTAGANPNKPATLGNGASSWCLFLSFFFRTCINGDPSIDSKAFKPTIILLLNHGADPDVKCLMESGPSSNYLRQLDWEEKVLSVDEILVAHYAPDDSIFQLLKEKRRKRHKVKKLLKFH